MDAGGAPLGLDTGTGVVEDGLAAAVAAGGATPPVEGGATMTATSRNI